MGNDDWMTAAMADDSLVAQLLLRLNHSHASTSDVCIPVCWGLTQPRSRAIPPFRPQPVSHEIKNVDSTRCSPSTPLSWSAGLSSSPTSDASEYSSHPARSETLAELKMEEGLLLGKEAAMLRGTFEEHTANNESFKRMKLNMNMRCSSSFSCPINQSDVAEAGNYNSNGDEDFLLPDLNAMPGCI